MMQQLAIGKTIIPYTIRHSDTAQRKRIIVTPNHVEVIAPKNTNTQDVAAFIHKKRRWVYDKQEEMQERLLRFEQNAYMHLQSGAKIPFRGRNMRLRIVRAKAEKIEICYQNGFNVIVPKHIPEALVESSVGLELTFWLKDRLKEDARQMAKHYCQVLGLKYRGIKITAPAKLWGSCTKQGIITLNWHLIAAPKAVLEYVVLHEVCHLKNRNHSNEFWALISSLMQDYAARKKWLETSNPSYSL
ncbi:MAG: M48 family metallopeptidase [Pseudomonadota bacterium]|nr:M48 family metallopeptidase [Pseudomonadota bacterium]MDE3037107.1 M48 family metallopeptidase [Pseudomonadota bacterium]